ncbi:hypothetical protein MKX01_037070, partial [Papaver californicum]
DPAKHVFRIGTDMLNYPTIRMWFLSNPPSQATIQVQNIEEFTWLNASDSPVLKQLCYSFHDRLLFLCCSELLRMNYVAFAVEHADVWVVSC